MAEFTINTYESGEELAVEIQPPIGVEAAKELLDLLRSETVRGYHIIGKAAVTRSDTAGTVLVMKLGGFGDNYNRHIFESIAFFINPIGLHEVCLKKPRQED